MRIVHRKRDMRRWTAMGQSRRLTGSRRLPVYPAERTFSGSAGMSQRCHVWTAPAMQEESDVSAKRSGAVMYPAFECSHFGRWPRCDPLIGSQTKARVLSSRGTLRVFPIDGLDRFASMSSSPLQFVNARTQPHPPIAELLIRLPRVGALGRSRPWPAMPKRSAPSCWPARRATTLNGRRARS